ncbi:bacterial Fmu (Sun)/eukaryotic nucleolar NOL1/Nop2p [Tanacetum coccineum]
MWKSAKTAAPTPNSVIVQLDVDDNFVINITNLKMIWENKFDVYPRADPHDHIREFLASCDMFKYGETQSEAVKLLIFPLSLFMVLIDNIKDSAPIIYTPTRLGKTGAHEEEPPVINDLTMVIGSISQVLVDAECTHDGSIKHIQKFENWGWTTLERRVLDAERTDDLTVLQFRLLTNGFNLLKVGGYLVYSTCSLTCAQNEDVVEKFLL